MQLIQKMSTLHPSLESRTKLLKEIAAENGIVLHLDEVFEACILAVIILDMSANGLS